MGTKRALSPVISEILEGCRRGPLLDAFAGMCSIGSTVGPTRQIWANDLQIFSNTVAKALFCSADPPEIDPQSEAELQRHFSLNMRALGQAYGEGRLQEMAALRSLDHVALAKLFERSITKTDHGSMPSNGSNNLFTERYGGTFFSYEQAMEIDSLRFATDRLQSDGTLTDDQAAWLLIAAAVAMNRCTTSPGHFAQPIAPKQSNISRIARERTRSVLAETMRALTSLSPIGSKEWRAQNRVYSGDALTLWDPLESTCRHASLSIL